MHVPPVFCFAEIGHAVKEGFVICVTDRNINKPPCVRTVAICHHNKPPSDEKQDSLERVKPPSDEGGGKTKF